MKPSKVDGPSYPPIAKAARIQGAVISRLEFDAHGNVSKVEIVNGHALLAKAVETSEARGSLAQTWELGDARFL
jgi:hypothetical protein